MLSEGHAIDAVTRPPISPDVLPTPQDLEALFRQKHGDPDTVGWAPSRRFRAGYFYPADVYEALVSKLVPPGGAWLDVGGGHQIFPENPRLARDLAARCARVAAVDPSENVLHNEFVQERTQAMLEDYAPAEPFDLATMRMVVEHVAAPEKFVGSLARLLRPGGVAVVLTINRYAPISLVSGLMPFGLHHPVKKLFWGGDEKDTFPVQYRMNTRSALRRVFAAAGFAERAFAKLDDLSTFGKFRRLNYLELLMWRGFRGLGLTYPENCLLGVYQRSA